MAPQDAIVKTRRKVWDTDDEDQIQGKRIDARTQACDPIATSCTPQNEIMRQPYTEDEDGMPLAEGGREQIDARVRENQTIATPVRNSRDECQAATEHLRFEDEEDISLSKRRRRAAGTFQSPRQNNMPLWSRRRKVVDYNEDSPLETPTPIKEDLLGVSPARRKMGASGRGRKEKASATTCEKATSSANDFESSQLEMYMARSVQNTSHVRMVFEDFYGIIVQGKADAELMASTASKRRDVESKWAVSRYGPSRNLAANGGGGSGAV
ncbi:hypothetical protein AC579_3951 [Pseudocercospora musae]|uniref:Uncharacterized protein n=1 Tax=Pseudocercospora musae TaxID=113226 RepID=A0A139GT07_9PEZI|nr:hypothetical protein AC579_3951 [Pseudocercospora musae]KXS93324.1 hypothetical protein AC579_3951 [Pseudocercospora musae]